MSKKILDNIGFTLVEMVVVVAIVAITAAIAVPSLIGFIDEGRQTRRNEDAKTIFLAAQNQLTQLRAVGNLKNAYGTQLSGQYFLLDDDGSFLNELNPTFETISLNNVYLKLGEMYPNGDIENGKDGYVRYISKPAGHYPDSTVHMLLEASLGDIGVLNNAIVIEYNILTAKVLSVFYSDSVQQLGYDTADDKSNITAQRPYPYADERDQGYYGVDYTGDTPPENNVDISVFLYDGYRDDIAATPERLNTNEPLSDVGSDGDYLQNVLYAEILIEKTGLDKPINLAIDGVEVATGLDLSRFEDGESFEDALSNFNINDEELIFRNDNRITGAVEDDFARFIWVLDYVGGDMTDTAQQRYSITRYQTKFGVVLSPSDEIKVSAIQTSSGNMQVVSNSKNPYYLTGDTPYGIASPRHLYNIRFTDITDSIEFAQKDDIDFSVDDNILSTNPLVMPPLPEFSGSYSGNYDLGDNTGAYTIKNLKVYDVNDDGNSVGLFESLTDKALVSHVMFIDPLITVENTTNQWLRPDAGKFAGVVAGFSTGTIHHITILSQQLSTPVVDDDTVDKDATNIRNDYVGGIVGMVGDSVKEDSIHHILYLAPAPAEENGSYTANYTRFDYPIIGTNQTIAANQKDNLADVELAKKAIADESCYYLVGQLLRPNGDDTGAPDENINVDVVSDGLGQPISTNDIYADMNNQSSEFYNNFIKTGDYGYVKGVRDPVNLTVDADMYPYPYYGNKLPDSGTVAQDQLSFSWPVAQLQPFKAQFVYYEIYGNKLAPNMPEVGVYSITLSTTDKAQNTLIDTDVQTNYRILSDGYAIRINRPYSMLDSDDIDFAVNGVEVPDEISSWLYRYAENPASDDFTDRFRNDINSTDIESILTIDNADLQAAVDSAKYGGDETDIMQLSIANTKNNSYSHSIYINPLFARALYIFKSSAQPEDMTYAIRSQRHLDNIGRYKNSTSHLSSYAQELNIDLLNYNKSFPSGANNANINLWSYNSLVSKPAGNLFSNFKYNNGIYIGGSGMEYNSCVAGTTYAFAGSYNGFGHSIDNLTLSATGGSVALFEETEKSGTIQDLRLNNFNITSSGLTIGAAVVAKNAGTLKNITVSNATVSGTYYDYAGSTTVPPGTNRPLEVGGAVAINTSTGILNDVKVVDSTVLRTEAGAGGEYNPNRRGAGGIAGDNSGLIVNSGVVDSIISVADNVVGGIVGLMREDGTVKDSYFISNTVTADGTPKSAIGYDGTATGIGGNTPYYSIGGIVGGGEGTVADTLFLAVAPEVDKTGDGIADMINPLTDEDAAGITMIDNVFLSGDYYSDDGVNWVRYDYNSVLPSYGTADKTGLIALGSEFINRSWLETNADNQLSNWTQLPPYPYPLAPFAEETQVPYATSSFLSPETVGLSSEVGGSAPVVEVSLYNKTEDRSSYGNVDVTFVGDIFIDPDTVTIDNGDSFLVRDSDFTLTRDDGTAILTLFGIEILPNTVKKIQFNILPADTIQQGSMTVSYNKTDFSIVNTRPIVSNVVEQTQLFYYR